MFSAKRIRKSKRFDVENCRSQLCTFGLALFALMLGVLFAGSCYQASDNFSNPTIVEIIAKWWQESGNSTTTAWMAMFGCAMLPAAFCLNSKSTAACFIENSKQRGRKCPDNGAISAHLWKTNTYALIQTHLEIEMVRYHTKPPSRAHFSASNLRADVWHFNHRWDPSISQQLLQHLPNPRIHDNLVDYKVEGPRRMHPSAVFCLHGEILTICDLLASPPCEPFAALATTN